MMTRKNTQRGAALVLAVGYVALVGIFAASFLAYWNHSRSTALHAAWSQTCLNLAEAGIHKALAEHARDPGYTGESNTPLGQGRFSVLLSPEPGPGMWIITATGEIIGGTQVVAHRTLTTRCVIGNDGVVRSLQWEE